MMCTHCDFRSDEWKHMKQHYKVQHPEVKNPGKFFTTEAKMK